VKQALNDRYDTIEEFKMILRAVKAVIDQPASYLVWELCVHWVKMHWW